MGLMSLNKIPSMAAVNTSIPEAQQDFKKERKRCLELIQGQNDPKLD